MIPPPRPVLRERAGVRAFVHCHRIWPRLIHFRVLQHLQFPSNPNILLRPDNTPPNRSAGPLVYCTAGDVWHIKKVKVPPATAATATRNTAASKPTAARASWPVP